MLSNNVLPTSNRFIQIIETNYTTHPHKQCLSFYHKEKHYLINNEQLYKSVRSLSSLYCEHFKSLDLGHDDIICYLGEGLTVLNQLSLMFCNMVPFFLSAKNSTEINYKLIEKCNAKVLVCDPSYKDLIKDCETKLNIKVVFNYDENVELLIQKYDESKQFKVLNDLDKESQGDKIGMCMHSSGTTSLPKVLPLSNKRIFVDMNRVLVQRNENNYHRRIMVLLPVYHLYGIYNLFVALLRKSLICFPRNLNNIKAIYQDLTAFECSALATSPFFLHRLYEYSKENEETNTLNILQSLDIVDYAGALLPEALGDKLIKDKINVVNLYGSTETGIFAIGDASKKVLDYKKLYVCPDTDYELVPIKGEQNRFEIIINKEDPSKRPEITNRPGNRYAIGDEVEIVDQTDGMAIHIIGRIDDTIVHVNGEKTNPVPIEYIINDNQYVEKSALLGESKMFNCVLVQLNKEAQTHSILTVWDSIKQSIAYANEVSPSHSRIFEELVYVLPSGKDIPSTAKGTISRKKAMLLFEAEIRELYKRFDGSNQTKKSNTNNISNNTLEETQQLFKKVTNKVIETSQNIFKAGLDSLTVVQFRNYLNNLYPGLNIKTSQIYSNPTLQSLSSLINSHFKGEKKSEKSLKDHEKDINELCDKYTIQSDHWNTKKVIKNFDSTGTSVLVTGGNGSLGAHLVHLLSKSSKIQKVYALVRSKTNAEAAMKIKESFSQKKLDYSQKVIALSYDYESENLGIDSKLYSTMKKELGAIYNIAWRMDFLKNVKEFEDNIIVSTKLLKLCSETTNMCVYNFVSSIGATFPHKPRIGDLIKEEMLPLQLSVLENCNGYNLSKLTTEHICQRWSNQFGFPMNIYRVGQISGDSINGVWNTQESVSLLIKSSQTMNMLPSNAFHTGVNWMPVNVVAEAINEISNLNNTNKITHITHPKNYSWPSILEHLKNAGLTFETVSNETFINNLKNNPKFQNVIENPISALTDFFEIALNNNRDISMFGLDITQTCKISKSMTNCIPINGDLVRKYIQYWRSIGFMQ